MSRLDGIKRHLLLKFTDAVKLMSEIMVVMV